MEGTHLPRAQARYYQLFQEARSAPDLNMEEVWDRLGVAEEADRNSLRGYYKMDQANHGAISPHIPPDTCLYDLDDF